MKKAIVNGKVYLKQDSFAEAVLIDGNKIERTGTSKEILATASADWEIIDVQGKTVLPGINDSHLHLQSIGEWLTHCDLTKARSVSDVIETGKGFLAEHPDRRAVRGVGYNQDYFTDEKRPLRRHDLDQISTEIPLVFCRVCGHILTVNTKALELLGIDSTTPQFDGGVFEIGEDGQPNGIFSENATQAAMEVLPAPTAAEIEQMYMAAMEYAVSVGITSVQSNDVRDENAEEICAILHKLYDENKLLLRFHHQCCFMTAENLQHFLETEAASGRYNDDMLTLGSLKLFKDGSLGARTALMRREYQDQPGRIGVTALSCQQMDDLCAMAAKYDFPVVTHVIGDAAVEQTLDSYEKIMKDGGNLCRNSLIHCQITDRPLLERIARLNVPCMVQPIFLNYDMHIAADRVGAALASTSYAFQTLMELGAPVAYGTDSPVENCNPFPCIYCAVTRKDLEGSMEFFPAECVSVQDAVDCYTSGSAYVEFKEDRKGRLHPGFLADLIVLDRDIFTIPADQIKDIQVELTMVDGRVVYDRLVPVL